LKKAANNFLNWGEIFSLKDSKRKDSEGFSSRNQENRILRSFQNNEKMRRMIRVFFIDEKTLKNFSLKFFSLIHQAVLFSKKKLL